MGPILLSAICAGLAFICLKVRNRAIYTIAVERAVVAHYASLAFAAIAVLSLVFGVFR